MSLLDRLRNAGKQLPPSHVIDNPHDLSAVLSALALYLEHGEAILTAAESNDPQTGLEMALHQLAYQGNQAEIQRQQQQAAQAPQVQFSGGPIIPGQQSGGGPAFATQTGAAGAFAPPPAYQPPPSIFGAPPQPQSTPFVPPHPPARTPEPPAPQGQPGPIYTPPYPQQPAQPPQQGFAPPPQQQPAQAQYQQGGGPQLGAPDAFVQHVHDAPPAQQPGPVFTPNPGTAAPDGAQQFLYQLLQAAQGMAADQGHAGRAQLDSPPSESGADAPVPDVPSVGAGAPTPPVFDPAQQPAAPGVPDPDNPLGGEVE